MGIVVIGAVFVDIKGYPFSKYIPDGRNAGNIEVVHGGVARNVVEDIANVELRPTFVSLVDDTGNGVEVIQKLQKHKVNTSYISAIKDGMGTWLAIFDTNGEVRGSISRRPDLMPIFDILNDKGDEIIEDCDSVVLEFDIDIDIMKKTIELAKKYNKKVFAVISNMSIAIKRRDMLKDIDCIVCNKQEAEILFSEDYEDLSNEEMEAVVKDRVISANINQMVITLGENGAVYSDMNGNSGHCPAWQVGVVDTTGAGDAFFAGVAIGLTYNKELSEACMIGTRLAASVICTKDNVCPRFQPSEFGIDINYD